MNPQGDGTKNKTGENLKSPVTGVLSSRFSPVFFGLPVLSAALGGRDAVRPKRAGTTLQNYNFSVNPQGDAAFLVKNLSYKKINRQCHGQAKPYAQPDDLALILPNPVALYYAYSAGLLLGSAIFHEHYHRCDLASFQFRLNCFKPFQNGINFIIDFILKFLINTIKLIF